MEKEKVVCIISGGMDSTTLIYDLFHDGFDVHGLSFNYGQKHKRELNMAKKTCKNLNIPHKVLNLKILKDIAPSALTTDNIKVPEGHYADENMKLTVVPNRNMVMLSLAVAYAIGIGAKKVYYGAHTGDHSVYPDCRPEFIDALNKAVQLADWSVVTLEAPFSSLDKGGIVERGIFLGVNYRNTLTCYNGGEKPCLKCGSCRERIEAFMRNNIRDPLVSKKEWLRLLRGE